MRIVNLITTTLGGINRLPLSQQNMLASTISVKNTHFPFNKSNRDIDAPTQTNSISSSVIRVSMANSQSTASTTKINTVSHLLPPKLDQAKALIDNQLNTLNLTEACQKDAATAYQTFESWFAYVYSKNKDSFAEITSLLGNVFQKKYIGHLDKASEAEYAKNIKIQNKTWCSDTDNIKNEPMFASSINIDSIASAVDYGYSQGKEKIISNGGSLNTLFESVKSSELNKIGDNAEHYYRETMGDNNVAHRLKDIRAIAITAFYKAQCQGINHLYTKALGAVASNAGVKGNTVAGIFTPAGVGANPHITNLLSPVVMTFRDLMQGPVTKAQLEDYAADSINHKLIGLCDTLRKAPTQPFLEQAENKNLTGTLLKFLEIGPKNFAEQIAAVDNHFRDKKSH